MIRIFWTKTERIDTEAVYGRCSAERRDRADACGRDADRRRSLAATAMLENALASVGLREAEQRYGFRESGKPVLSGHPDLHFSISHSGAYAVCAIADRPVGVDVESPRSVSERLQKRCFTESELAAAEPLRLWTLKEAFCKMTGRGLQGLAEVHLLFGEGVSAEGVPAWFYEWLLEDGTHISLCISGGTSETPEIFK